MSGRKGEWLLTYTGTPYWPLDPRPEEVYIADIAHALSLICRYTGHVKYFYSVSEHCLLVSHMVPPELALEGLLHDAAEAYCSDINKPLKMYMPEYKEIEALNQAAIRIRFGLSHTEHPDVKQADSDILFSEYSQLMPPLPVGFNWRWGGTARSNVEICGLTPTNAERLFLKRFYELGGKEQ